MKTVFEGGCLCGAVRYRLTGPPVIAGSCHCRTCRKASSAPELPFAQFPSAVFTLTKGLPRHLSILGSRDPLLLSSLRLAAHLSP